jgi:predicted nuclease with TOPRIM domain
MSELTTEHFDEVITGFKAHVDERFEKVDEHFERVEGRLDKIDARLSELADFTALRENVRHLETRLTVLETTHTR